MFDPSWNSQMHQIEVAELEKRNLHVFLVEIDGHGTEEVAFQGMTRQEAEKTFARWLETEPHVRRKPDPPVAPLATLSLPRKELFEKMSVAVSYATGDKSRIRYLHEHLDPVLDEMVRMRDMLTEARAYLDPQSPREMRLHKAINNLLWRQE